MDSNSFFCQKTAEPPSRISYGYIIYKINFNVKKGQDTFLAESNVKMSQRQMSTHSSKNSNVLKLLLSK
jgi:hypothetical protein